MFEMVTADHNHHTFASAQANDEETFTMVRGIPFGQTRDEGREEGLTSYVTDDDSRIYIESSDDEMEPGDEADRSLQQWFRVPTPPPQVSAPVKVEQPVREQTAKPKPSSKLTYAVVVLVVFLGLIATGIGTRIFVQKRRADVESSPNDDEIVAQTEDNIVPTPWPTLPMTYPTLSPTTDFSLRVPGLIRTASKSTVEFDDPRSPESLALELVRTSTTSGGFVAEEQILQTYAVAVLASSFGSTVYNTVPMILGNECDLEGITCNNDVSSFHRVVNIDWPSYGFKGSIPADIGLLSDLEVLNLSGNNIQGSLPLSFYNLSSLREVYLNGNAITGEIPTQIENLQNLQTLFLGDNQLVGEILSYLDTLHSLEWVSLFNNHFSGDLPQVLRLPYLRTLDLGNNVFWGTIPWSWFDGDSALGSLEGLFLDSNYLTGPVPHTWDRLENIETIVLSHNQLTGEFPGKFRSDVLTTIEIQGNEFKKVSKDICKLSEFREDGPLSTLRTDCGICSCTVLCHKDSCVP